VWEVKLVEEQARGLHSFDRRDLSVELEEVRACVVGIDDEHVIEAGELLWFVMEISNALVDLGMLPIWDIPQLSKTTKEVLVAPSLILECLREGNTYGAVP
jgi:hypothetical protein